jgi:hypothetical protein
LRLCPAVRLPNAAHEQRRWGEMDQNQEFVLASSRATQPSRSPFATATGKAQDQGSGERGVRAARRRGSGIEASAASGPGPLARAILHSRRPRAPLAAPHRRLEQCVWQERDVVDDAAAGRAGRRWW